MASTAIPGEHSATTNFNMTAISSFNKISKDYHTVLLAIYTVVLLSGTINLYLMMHIIKSNRTSITSIAVLNLIFSHFIFLFTVPFRIYYYTIDNWMLGPLWCRVVSSMIHIHMYMSFIFYVIILSRRLRAFYSKAKPVASSKIPALLLSALMWTLVFTVVPCVIYFTYGTDAEEGLDQKEGTTEANRCFMFGKNIQFPAKVMNYIGSTVIIVVAMVLTALQANILRVLYRKHRQGCNSQQDFGAQQKSMYLSLIMVVCFIPYHLFRLNYLEDGELESVNEVFLSLTAFNCLDMLTFSGGGTCHLCFRGAAT